MTLSIAAGTSLLSKVSPSPPSLWSRTSGRRSRDRSRFTSTSTNVYVAASKSRWRQIATLPTTTNTPDSASCKTSNVSKLKSLCFFKVYFYIQCFFCSWQYFPSQLMKNTLFNHYQHVIWGTSYNTLVSNILSCTDWKLVFLDKCLTHPCSHNGTCVNLETNRFQCICTPGFSGPNCIHRMCSVSMCTLYFHGMHGVHISACADKYVVYAGRMLVGRTLQPDVTSLHKCLNRCARLQCEGVNFDRKQRRCWLQTKFVFSTPSR